MRRVYLDNAATSWPKPEAVLKAVTRYQNELGTPAGRSGYQRATEVERDVAAVRRKAAEFFGAASSEHVIFTAGCTDGLNVVLQSLRQRGGHVITTTLEHNSVLRPLTQLEREGAITVTRLEPSLIAGCITAEQVSEAWREDTKLVALIHASNVIGTVQPTSEIAEVAHACGGRLLLDAAQTAGHFSCTLASTGADYLVTAAHKGLLGILGLGLLILKDDAAAADLLPLRFGGTGSKSDLDIQPKELPDRFEAGSPNLPAIYALGAGLDYVMDQGVDTLHKREQVLSQMLKNQLADIEGVTVYGPHSNEPTWNSVGVISLNVAGVDPRELATMLDATAGVEARAGMHCAPLLHKALGTVTLGGTLRLSVGPFTTEEDVTTAATAIAEIAAAFVG